MSATLVFLFLLTGIFVVLLIVGIIWSIRSGQFEDMEGPAARILMDDDDPRLPGRKPLSRDEE
ncbi:cbb3-type cytochrome oxidase assembly protein CcoS [Betaproteobacteria bacterium SCN2]|jgi:cbb3-type cytochrome oxidase maturation protein|nr:cbb3-type cytochrome oxidase assembly protein CcoS [Betaproteobacteria bacterium SCN2]